MLLAALFLLQAAPQCAATDAALAANLAGWTTPAAAFGVNEAVTLQAGDLAKLRDVPAGTKPGGAAMIEFKVDTAGRYGVALDQRGWIDVVPGTTGGEALKSVAHGHGPACSTIRKIVRFDLQPGTYRLYLTGLDKPSARTMLVAGD
jgi:flagellar basal body rod protein FlgF